VSCSAELRLQPESDKALERVGRDVNRQRIICIWKALGRFGSGLISLWSGERNLRGIGWITTGRAVSSVASGAVVFV